MNLFLYVLIASFVTLVNCLPVKEKFKTGYETCPTGLKDKLNVHLVCHTHNDVGWLKTVDQYFYGARNNIQNAGVQYILDSVVQALKYDKTKRFIYVETAFFSRWWNEQHDSVHHAIKKLVCNGQLEFIGGGWSMNDEAATHYNSIIDQMTFGLRVLNDTFGACGVPKVAWQIDPFGHSKEQASLFAQMYYDGLFFGRLDYQDKDLRKQTKTMEHVWMPSLMNLGHSADLFTGALPNSYGPPSGFCYDILCDDPPIMKIADYLCADYGSLTVHQCAQVAQEMLSQGDSFLKHIVTDGKTWIYAFDTATAQQKPRPKRLRQILSKIKDDPNLKDYNVNERVSAFIDIAEEQAKSYATNHIVMTMGNDFNYQNAHTWYKNLDKLIKHVNERQKNGSRVNVFYSTPSCYLYALNKANVTWSTKTDDFLPYASDPHAYWTGYFTSRPSIKRYERIGNNKLQVCKQLAARIDIEEITLDFMRKAMGIMQHHDAITGTAKQHVTNDYAETLASAIETCHDIVTEAYEKLMPVDKKVNTSQPLKQYFCNYLNISSCNFTEENIPIAVTIYNPLAWNVSEYIRLPVTGKAYNVTDYNLQLVESQLVPIPPPVLNVPGRKSKAQSEIVFKVDLPPLGYGTYLIRNTSSEQVLKAQSSQVRAKAEGDWIMKNEFLTVIVDGKSGLLTQLQLVDGFNLTVNQSFYWYRGMNGNNSEFDFRASGAYIFRPNGTEPLPLGNNVTLTYVNGSLVQEIHQTFTPWLSQSIRLYKGVKNVELKWIVGPIPYEDNVGKEIITRFDTDLMTNAEFYTDSNGREMVKRKRNYRETWTLNVTEPVSGNYYPVNSRIFIRDPKTHRQFTVLTDRSQGGSSIKDGSIELMVHRRLFMDDAFGVGEALNETGVDGRGLVITGSHFLVLDYMNRSAAIHRPLAQKLYLQPEISFMTYNMSDEALKKSLNLFSPGLKTPFPPNVHLLTLEPWKRDTYLIRLEHFFGFDEDLNLSRPTNVSLKDRFTNFEILNLEETTLSANQYLEKAKRLTWNVNKGGIRTTTGYKGYRKDKDLTDLNIFLDSMQIRTFVAKIKV